MASGDPSPFRCPACGYVCVAFWDQADHDEEVLHDQRFGCHELLGMILVDEWRGVPFHRACLHADGTQAYIPEKGPPLLQGDAALEQRIYRHLGSLLFAWYDPQSPVGWVLDLDADAGEEDKPQLFTALADLSDQSALYRYALQAPRTGPYDWNLSALQAEVLALVREHYWRMLDTGLGDLLMSAHVVTPAQIRQALEA